MFGYYVPESHFTQKRPSSFLWLWGGLVKFVVPIVRFTGPEDSFSLANHFLFVLFEVIWRRNLVLVHMSHETSVCPTSLHQGHKCAACCGPDPSASLSLSPPARRRTGLVVTAP